MTENQKQLIKEYVENHVNFKTPTLRTINKIIYDLQERIGPLDITYKPRYGSCTNPDKTGMNEKGINLSIRTPGTSEVTRMYIYPKSESSKAGKHDCWLKTANNW